MSHHGEPEERETEGRGTGRVPHLKRGVENGYWKPETTVIGEIGFGFRLIPSLPTTHTARELASTFTLPQLYVTCNSSYGYCVIIVVMLRLLL